MAYEELLLPDRAAWRAWLTDHAHDGVGVTLVLARKGVTDPTSIAHDEALLEALCFGWIDSLAGRRDEYTVRQRYGPRGPRSTWSQRNVGLAGQLIDHGLMQPGGLREIDRAKQDGRWAAAYAGSATMPVPEALQQALGAVPAAQAMWDVLTSQNRYALLFRLHHLRTEAGRTRRIAATVEQLAHGKTPYPQKRRPDQDVPSTARSRSAAPPPISGSVAGDLRSESG